MLTPGASSPHSMSNNESDYFDQAQPFSGLTSSSSSYASEPYSEGSFVPSSAHSYLDGPYSEGDQADLPSSHAHYGIGSEFDGLGDANFFDNVVSKNECDLTFISN